jgi:hypothetical protein
MLERVPLAGLTVIADKGFAGAEFEGLILRDVLGWSARDRRGARRLGRRSHQRPSSAHAPAWKRGADTSPYPTRSSV